MHHKDGKKPVANEIFSTLCSWCKNVPILLKESYISFLTTISIFEITYNRLRCDLKWLNFLETSYSTQYRGRKYQGVLRNFKPF